VLAAGGDPAKVVFSGVAKSEAEMRLALEKRSSASTWSPKPSWSA
jgi:diaminopimelate decarboxylase